MYQCTKCASVIEKTIENKYFQYFCDSCNSTYISLSSLRKLGYNIFVKHLWKNIHSAKPSIYYCPFCKKKQLSMNISSGNGDFPIEICKSCQFVWFDSQEILSLKKDPPPITKDKLTLKNKKLYARLKVQQDTLENDRYTTYTDYILAYLGFPVEHNKTKINNQPVITYFLIGLITMVYIINYIFSDILIYNFSFIPNNWFKYYGLTIFTSFFLHSGFWHLIGNLYFLYIFGDNVEDKTTRFSYIFLIICGHLFGLGLHSLLAKGIEIPVIGSSAGISAIVAYYVYLYPDVNIGITILYEYIRVNVTFLFIEWICIQLLFASIQLTENILVSGLAHLGGTIIGLAFAFSYNKNQKTPVNSR